MPGLASAMAEGLLPPLLAVGSLGAAFGAAPLTPLIPPQLFSLTLVECFGCEFGVGFNAVTDSVTVQLTASA